jgi:Cu/Ag efflux protein CusF
MTAACLAVVGFAATVAVAQSPADHPKGETVAATVEVTATVEKIDHETREVTLRTDDGAEYTFIADEAVANLPQVQKGDQVTATVTEALAYEVIKGEVGIGAEVTVAAAAADLGEMPAGVIGRKVTVAVTITAIDKQAPSVTFKGPADNTRTIKVLHPEKLEGVNVGDSVVITYAEAIAMKVQKATK